MEGGAIEVALGSERTIEPAAVRALYDAVDWFPERTPSDIAEVLRTGASVGAWHHQRLVGFARSISDERFHAYIDDVVVHPAFQSRGIGRQLVCVLVDELAVNDVSLFCADEQVSFYEGLGFRMRPSQRVLHTKRPSA